MSLGEDQADCCPHCRKPFEIVHVEFRLNGTAMIACCPNCAMVSVDVGPAAESQIIEKAKTLAITTRVFWQKVATPMMKSTNDRFRYVLALIIGALATAPPHSHLRRTSPRRNSRGCAIGHSNCCARNSLLPQKAPHRESHSSVPWNRDEHTSLASAGHRGQGY
jgi:hypothetical protein